MTRLTMKSPIFGTFYLSEREGVPDSETTFGYLDTGGGKLRLSFFRHGEWCGRDLKPYGRAFSKWFAMEKNDGSPFFN